MKRYTKKTGIACLLTLSLTAGLLQPGAGNVSAARLNQKKLTLVQGKKYTLKVRGASGKITWKSSRNTVASVSPKGKVTAKKAGKTKITAKMKSRKFVCRVTVKKRNHTAIQKPGSTNKPTATQKPIGTNSPAATQKPAGTNLPAVTQKPGNTNSPAVTQKPGSTDTPVSIQKPVVTNRPIATQKPIVTNPPVSTSRPVPTSKPNTTNKPVSTPSPSVSPVTEESAYNTLNALRDTYPEGMTLTNSYYYYSPQFGNGYGCYGFAAKLSDTVFGTAAPYSKHSAFDRIRVGDNIRIGNSHSVIVLTKNDHAITVVEGNYNSSVHWDRKISSSSLASSGFTVYTRY